MSWLSFRRWWLTAFVVGVLAGVLWWAITDTASWTITKDGPSTTDDETRQQFGAIVNFVLIGAGLSAVLGFAVAYFSDVSWPAVPAVALMAGQAAVLTWLIGGLLGPDSPSGRGPIGSTVQDALSVDAVAPFFAWAVFGVAGLLIGMALFEHEPSRSEARDNPQ